MCFYVVMDACHLSKMDNAICCWFQFKDKSILAMIFSEMAIFWLMKGLSDFEKKWFLYKIRFSPFKWLFLLDWRRHSRVVVRCGTWFLPDKTLILKLIPLRILSSFLPYFDAIIDIFHVPSLITLLKQCFGREDLLDELRQQLLESGKSETHPRRNENVNWLYIEHLANFIVKRLVAGRCFLFFIFKSQFSFSCFCSFPSLAQVNVSNCLRQSFCETSLVAMDLNR